MPRLVSCCTVTFSLAIGCQKLGQPVPDSNFVSELKSAVSQQMQRYRPFWWLLQVAPVNGNSVSSRRVTSNETFDSCFFHSAALLTTFGSSFTPSLVPSSENSAIDTSAGAAVGASAASDAA